MPTVKTNMQTFKSVTKHILGQEYYERLDKYDYAVALEVSDCMVVAVKYRHSNGRVEERVGHFGTRNIASPGASYRGFRSTFEDKEVLEIKYATNHVYSKKALRSVAAGLCKNTTLEPQDVQAYILPQNSFLDYRPIVYYRYSGAFRSCGDSSNALDKNLETNLEARAYPKPTLDPTGCIII